MLAPLATVAFQRLSEALGPPTVRWAGGEVAIGMTLTRDGWPVVSVVVPLEGGRGDGSCVRHFHPRTDGQVQDLARRLEQFVRRPELAAAVC